MVYLQLQDLKSRALNHKIRKAKNIYYQQELQKKWILIDAQDAVLGRLAVISANILRGKNKVNYTPNQDCGDYLVIINSDKVKLTGKKVKNKSINTSNYEILSELKLLSKNLRDLINN